MNNYDGPAYYRWHKNPEAVQSKAKQIKQQPQRETPIGQDVSKGPQSPKSSARMGVDSKAAPKQSASIESKFSQQIRKFEPKSRPRVEEPNSQMVHFFDRQSAQRTQFFDQLVGRLRVKTANLILFADPNDNVIEDDYSDTNSEGVVPETTGTVVNDLQQEDRNESVVPNLDSDDPEIEKVTDPNENEVDSTADLDVETAEYDSEERDEVPVETADEEANAGSESESNRNGLGRSFSSIIGGEANKSKLPFFEEEDEVEQPSELEVDEDEDVVDTPIAATEEIEEQSPVNDNDEINQRFKNPVEVPEDVVVDGTAGTEKTVEIINEPTTGMGQGVTETKAPFNPAEYQFPDMNLLTPPVDTDDDQILDWIEHQIDVLDKTLAAFGVEANVVDWTNGPTVTQFQIKLALGVKVQRIVNLRDDLKLALAAKDVRIEAPIPGKSTVGIEIPNQNPRPVMLSEILDTPKFADKQSPLTTAVGVDIAGRPQVTDIRKMPHGLIAGATGSGKSVFINSLLVSLLYKANPAEVKLLLIDPKAVELAPYDGVPHLLSPVISDPQEAAAALKWVTKEMDERYEKLSAAGVRNIEQFNDKAVEREEYGLKMPYILVIIDELADLMMVASSEIQDYIVRITQKARAAGIHLIVATQRPSVDIVTGTIKNNIPTRIAFMVSSQVDSRTIIDTSGAESLLGKGDMLYLGNGSPQPIRLQGAFVTNEELESVVDFVRQQGQPQYLFTPDSLKQVVESHNEDDLMPEVLNYINNEKTISTSKLQRLFSIGYNRAANIIDALERHNYISEQRGSKPREVYYHVDSDELTN